MPTAKEIAAYWKGVEEGARPFYPGAWLPQRRKLRELRDEQLKEATEDQPVVIIKMPDYWKVRSFSDPKIWYTVSWTGGCSCPSRTRDCKHQALINSLGLNPKDPAWSGKE